MAFVQIESLRLMTEEVLAACGVPADQAAVIADTAVYAHTHGRATHGITRFPIYVRKIREKLMAADTAPTVVLESPALCVLDARNGFGQVAAYEGMKRCMEMAKTYGIGACGVRNSNNFGVTAYFGEIAARAGMVGVVIGAAAPAIAPTGGKKPIFGTNPICVALPGRGDTPPIILDMATSEAARGKVRLAQKNGEKIPFGWAIDKNGEPTDDPAAALEGTMLPIGGYKGYGIALILDVLAGLLTGSAFGGEIKPLNEPADYSRHGHAMMAIDVARLMPLEEYFDKIDALVERVRACGDPGSVLLPGEIEYRKYASCGEAVEINPKQVDEFNALAEQLGIAGRL